MSFIRKKPSGRYEARYRDPSGRLRGKTFSTKREAQQFLDRTGAAIVDQAWRDPALGKVRLSEYTTWWLDNRPDLRPRTHELYEILLRLHITPHLGHCRFEVLNTATIRAWHAEMLRKGKPGPVTVAKAYRLLRTILNAAVEDGLLIRNPCSIKGAGVERSPERPVATIEQVYRLADTIEPRFRLMVLLATFCGLRLGELLALRRDRFDLDWRQVTVVEQVVELADGIRLIGPPKTEASRRVVAIPPHLVEEVESHLDNWVDVGEEALIFTATDGGLLRRSNFRQRAWDVATSKLGLSGLHFHDLRHTGNTLAAATGASTKELMARMGHASSRAALIYQHATEDRDIAIANVLSAMVGERFKPDARSRATSTEHS